MNLTSRTSLLVFLAHLDPRLYEPLKPHVPMLSAGARHVMAATVINDISKEVKDAGISKELLRVGKLLFNSGKETLEYEDELCYWPKPPIPPIPWYELLGVEEAGLSPQPLPPHEQPYYGALLVLLSHTLSPERMQESVRHIGESLIKKY
ncbi:hypothetical protein Q4E93_22835 [Flavitalea sp. BT771]|uniref:hypothetical protein n=1 Tax=Flavitalea sp. BT771 TaxID=3063329 RepID=UPI0026E1C04A|nr:hypothetical protein [Flavitalea sp. BT771]MDO6433467.1 hypothetical protein [Flavitalea sp. BT771]MDV6222628.1 hypothetical protein [Flavitalea sp. BT771]